MHSVFLWIVGCYGLVCVTITLLCTLSKAGIGDLILDVNTTYENRLLADLMTWHVSLQDDVASCLGAQCAVDISLQAINLFFLFTYIPVCAMFAAFVLMNPTIQKTLFGDYLSSFLPGGVDAPTEMPPLEHDSGSAAPTPGRSGNRRRTSSSGRNAAKRAGSQLVYDETFGIIRKDIIDSWSRRKRPNSIDTTAEVPSTQARNTLPPVRLVTPKASDVVR